MPYVECELCVDGVHLVDADGVLMGLHKASDKEA